MSKALEVIAACVLILLGLVQDDDYDDGSG